MLTLTPDHFQVSCRSSGNPKVGFLPHDILNCVCKMDQGCGGVRGVGVGKWSEEGLFKKHKTHFFQLTQILVNCLTTVSLRRTEGRNNPTYLLARHRHFACSLSSRNHPSLCYDAKHRLQALYSLGVFVSIACTACTLSVCISSQIHLYTKR